MEIGSPATGTDTTIPRQSRTRGEMQTTLVQIATRGAWLFAPLAVIQFALYVFGLRDNVGHWAAYWAYLLAGVILPGTALLLAFVRWRADWLTWLGLGWAVGHGCELIALLLARRVGDTRLLVLWAPLAVGVALLRRSAWRDTLHERLVPLRHSWQALGVLLPLFILGAVLFFGYNVPFIGPQTVTYSDMWFHFNNTHAFRDSATGADPRIAGVTLNYHMFGYAPSAAASAVTGDGVMNLLP